MSVLEIKNLTKKYGNVTAVNDLTVSISEGSVMGILGPNGSGKTTTIACILGLVFPENGTYKWFDNPENVLDNTRIGALIEQPNFYPYLSAVKNLEIVAKVRGIEDYAEEINRVLEIVNLGERKTSSFSTFSFGMKQRLAIAAALLGDPEVLIFDEPTNGLDPQGIAFVRNIIQEQAKKGKTIVLASHILDEVEKVCTDVLILKKGSVIAKGKVSDVLNESDKIYIASDDNQKLLELLSAKDLIENSDFENEFLVVTLKNGYSTREISDIAFENKILFTKLESRKKTLETEFLELIK